MAELQERLSEIQEKMYRRFYIKLQFCERVYGGLPKTRELVEKYVRAKFDSTDIYPVAEDLDLLEEVENMTTGFKADGNGLYIGSYQLKAALKQYASLLKLTVKKRGSKQTVKEASFVKGLLNGKLTGERIYLQPLRKIPDGLEDFVGHAYTPQGERSFLRTAEYVEQGILEFEIWASRVRMVGQKDMSEDDWLTLLVFGQECGIGSCRAREKGKYIILAFREVK